MDKSVGVVNLLKKKVDSARIRSRKAGQDCDLTDEMVFAILADQNGLCYYTGIPMTGKPGNLDNISIDRVESTKGYIRGNIVLCCEAINIMKNQMSYENLLKYSKDLIENALSLDDPCLLSCETHSCENESIGGKLRKVAEEREPEFSGVKIVRLGFSGFSAERAPP